MSILDSTKSDEALLEELATVRARAVRIETILLARKHLDSRVLPLRNETDAVQRGVDAFKDRARRVQARP